MRVSNFDLEGNVVSQPTMFPYVFPTLIIVPVLSMFKTSLVAVPAFILVLPVMTSPPTTGLIMKSTCPQSAITEGSVHATPTVAQPRLFAWARQRSTYGVRPEAAIPISESTEPLSWSTSRSRTAASVSSSAPSCACRIAASPPAIMPMNCPSGIENVGGISEASKMPNLFEVGLSLESSTSEG